MSSAIQRKIETLTASISDYDRQIEDLAKEAQVLREMKELDEDALATLKQRAAEEGLAVPAATESGNAPAQAPATSRIIAPAEPKIAVPSQPREPPPRRPIHPYGVAATHGDAPGRDHVSPNVVTDGRLAQEEL